MSLNEYDPYINDTRPTTSFIDLATRGQLENFMYGGRKAVTYFMRETAKSSWFTQIPIKMQLNTADVTFNEKFNAKISRSGDYLMNAWVRVTLNALSVYSPVIKGWDYDATGSETIIWTPNFMHNLLEDCKLKVNGMILDELFSEHLDFYAAFMIPKRSRIGYNRMIGNFTSPNNGLAGINVCGVKAREFPNINTAQELFLPLPFFFSKSPSMALPTASLPYADMNISFKFRSWKKLLSSISSSGTCRSANLNQLVQQIPTLSNVQVWGNYAIVTNEERKLSTCKPRDILIEQSQQVGGCFGSGKLLTTNWNSTTSIDLRLNGAVKALFFAARNQMTNVNLPFRSNYSTVVPSACDIWAVKISASGNDRGLNATLTGIAGTGENPPDNIHINWFNSEANDYAYLSWSPDGTSPFGTVKLLYENSVRIDMESDYYSLIQPYFHARNVPDSGCQHGIVSPQDPTEVTGNAALAVGYHMYSYALKSSHVDPTGSSNYSLLKNVTMVFTPSKTVVNLAADNYGPWFIFISAINSNILRVSNGSIGFPVL